MKKLFAIILSIIVFCSNAFAEENADYDMMRPRRKKVAVVLSGGGAKGVAHVRALKVIEEAGIPIDIVVGTSMGSIIGGLYAYGYTTDQLDSLIRVQNWVRLLTDGADRSTKSLELKLLMEKYIVSGTFEKDPFEVIEGGILKGNSIGRLFSELTYQHLDSMDYRKLPIPFACVATDIVNGKEVDMYSGILAESMRSSMAIPGVFSPIRKDGKVLVDGGLVNNYPADIAKKMGADIIIGVDVSSMEKTADEIKSTSDVLFRILDIICSNKYTENMAISDVVINVDVTGYSSASFSNVAIDSLLARGETAARAKWDELLELKKKIGRIGRGKVRQPIIQDKNKDVTPPQTIYREKHNNSFIGLGARFDNEELASLLLGGSYELNPVNRFRVSVETRLGKRSYGQLDVSVMPWKEWNVGMKYKYTDNEIKLYNQGNAAANVSFGQHKAGVYFRRSWKSVLVTFGSNWTYSSYSSLLTQTEWVDFAQEHKNEKSVDYYASVSFDNQDASVMPRRGMKWFVKYNVYTDNGYMFNGEAALHGVEGYFNAAIPLTKTFTLIPSVSGRIVSKRNTHLSNLNYIGGIDSYGHYMPQQVPFAGVSHLQIAPNDLLVLGMKLRHNFTTNNYAFAIANYGLSGNRLDEIVTIDSSNLFGTAIGYGYKSPIGPIEFNLNWSNVTNSVGAFLNIGYMF
ncbi:MAG: patatin-like phospholipase family protein [Bacteroidaceae bacterium]|nr:patatin-like phospholipase family protein [Bacteroidaceae bacterium]